MLRKYSNKAYTVKRIEFEKRELKDIIKRKDREIKDIKTECASEFKRIADLCFCNEFGGKYEKLSKIHEIAKDNFSALVTDLAIDKELTKKAKIIELTTTPIEISSIN